MSKPTKRQRHTLYKDALHIYQTDRQYDVLCGCLDIALDRRYPVLYRAYSLVDTAELVKAFPEFHEFKPKTASYFTAWWDRENRAKREKVLLSCIEQTKPKANGKGTNA